MDLKLEAAERPLTRREIERRVAEIEALVTGATRIESRAELGEPAWVDPAELVRRMQPYLGLN